LTAKVNAFVPDRDELRVLYDEAIAELNPSRNNRLTTPFYTKIGNAVFEAGYLAYSDTITGTRRMHTVPAPAGSGKSSFSFALLMAMTRYADRHPEAPHGAVMLVNEIEKAEKVYQELGALLPGRVRVWTGDHDRNCTKRTKLIEEPATKCTQPELRYWSVAIVTHSFYLDVNGHHARTVVRNGIESERALTVVDERPDEAPAIEIAQHEAQEVREALVAACPDAKEPMDELLKFMEQFNHSASNKLFRPGIELDYAALNRDLGWFQSEAAQRLLQSSSIPNLKVLFAFVRALVAGQACVATIGVLPYFFWYEDLLVIDRSKGAILLDATADIDGVSQIVGWRVQAETPKARYDRLEIIHVQQHTKTNLSDYLNDAPNQRAYVEHMLQTVRAYMEPGQKGLLLCKQILRKHERVPNWPDRDPRFQTPEVCTKQYGWNVEGRNLCVTHWGTGIGDNHWLDADVVFLFDEFILPRRTSISHTQGYRRHRADQGDLGSMKTMSSKARGVDTIHEGQILRWYKQMALRGNARNYDDHGVCGEQRLVVSGNQKRFMANVSKMFPGANVRTISEQTNDQTKRRTWSTRAFEVFNDAKGDVLTTAEVGKRLGKEWRKIGYRITTPEFLDRIGALGWTYVPNKGRSGSWFERVSNEPTDVALSSLVGMPACEATASIAQH
jgi:hypothetical protein